MKFDCVHFVDLYLIYWYNYPYSWASRVGRATDKRAELHCCDVSKIDFCVLDIGGRKDDFDGYCGGNKCCFACRCSAYCLRFNKRLVAVRYMRLRWLGAYWKTQCSVCRLPHKTATIQ